MTGRLSGTRATLWSGIALAAALALGPASAKEPLPALLGSAVTGATIEHVVQPGEHLGLISARYGVSWRLLAQANQIRDTDRLSPGQVVVVEARHIVPRELPDGIVINVPQRMLFHFAGGALRATYPVGLGRPSWPTPTGPFRVVDLQKDKTWCVPPSIQEEMRREGKPVLTEVPPGPTNPLGRHWIGLSLPGIGIHGTIAPSSVYSFGSHGCIRLHPDDVADLFAQVRIGTPGEIIYYPLLLAQLPDGRVFAEIHPDIYRRGFSPERAFERLISERGLTKAVDPGKLAAAIRARDGIARDVTMGSSQ